MFGFSEGLVSSSDGTEFGSHQHLWEHLFPSQAQINHSLSLSLIMGMLSVHHVKKQIQRVINNHKESHLPRAYLYVSTME
jgi:hypothetical protein